MVPTNGPVIFVANHPNFFMDPLIVGSLSPRKLHFFAKSTLFNTPIKNWIMSRLPLVPVYRKLDDEKNNNDYIQKLTDQHIGHIDHILKDKETDLMQV